MSGFRNVIEQYNQYPDTLKKCSWLKVIGSAYKQTLVTHCNWDEPVWVDSDLLDHVDTLVDDNYDWAKYAEWISQRDYQAVVYYEQVTRPAELKKYWQDSVMEYDLAA